MGDEVNLTGFVKELAEQLNKSVFQGKQESLKTIEIYAKSAWNSGDFSRFNTLVVSMEILADAMGWSPTGTARWWLEEKYSLRPTTITKSERAALPKSKKGKRK